MASSSALVVHKGKKRKTSETEISSIHVSRFSSSRVFRDFTKACSTRAVLIERIFDEQFLIDIKFPWLDRLKNWGWWEFVDFQGDVNPNLVRLFYFNGDAKKYDDDEEEIYGQLYCDSFKTTVLGKEMVVRAELLKNFVSSSVICRGEESIPDNFPFVDKCKLIFNDPSICCIEKRSSKMGFYTRILHLLVCQVFNPRSGDFANASERDLYFMAKIMEDDPPNLCEMIVRRMLEGVKHSKTTKNCLGLPYGKLVSRIVRAKCPVKPNELVDNSKAMEPLNEKSVRKMGWYQDPSTGEWKKKVKKNANVEEATSSGSSLERLESLMVERFSQLQMQMQHVNANVEALRRNEPFDVPFPCFSSPPSPSPPPSQP